MTISRSRLKGCLLILGLVVAGWGIILLIGYGLLRGILSLMLTADDRAK